MKRFFGYILVASLALISCRHIMGEKLRGNGVIKTETRNVNSFNSVDVSGNIIVYVKQDSAYSVRVEADENLMEHITVSNNGNELVIEPKGNAQLVGSKGVTVYVSGPGFVQLHASGASLIISENQLASATFDVDVSGASEARLDLKSPKISAELSGASNVILKGQTKDLLVDAQGASHAKCFELLSENAAVEVSGASGAEVFASVKVDADASGASSVKYKGAANHTGSASGASNINRVQ